MFSNYIMSSIIKAEEDEPTAANQDSDMSLFEASNLSRTKSLNETPLKNLFDDWNEHEKEKKDMSFVQDSPMLDLKLETSDKSKLDPTKCVRARLFSEYQNEASLNTAYLSSKSIDQCKN